LEFLIAMDYSKQREKKIPFAHVVGFGPSLFTKLNEIASINHNRVSPLQQKPNAGHQRART